MSCAICAAEESVKTGATPVGLVAATFFVEGYLQASLHTCREHFEMLERSKTLALEARERQGDSWASFALAHRRLVAKPARG